MRINRALYAFAAAAALLWSVTASNAATITSATSASGTCVYASNFCYVLPDDFVVQVQIDGPGSTDFEFEFTYTGGGEAFYFSTNLANDFTGEIRGGKVDTSVAAGSELALLGGGDLLSGPGPILLEFLTDTLYAIKITGSFAAGGIAGDLDFALTPVPIPPALLLFGSALLGLGYLARRRRASIGPELPA
jgi:hypothetical protein